MVARAVAWSIPVAALGAVGVSALAIATLGTLSIFFALNLYVSASTTIDGRDMDPIMTWTGTRVDVPFIETAVPISSFLMLGMYAIMWYILRYTAWGRHVYATGDDFDGDVRPQGADYDIGADEIQ